MAIVIDALDLVRNKKRLPREAFFVDTNILVDFIDPFSRSTTDPRLAARNVELAEVIHPLKSWGSKSLSTASVALEYYKYIQVGFYKIETGKDRLDTEDFKRLRDGDLDFMTRWDHQLKVFKRLFSKTFPLLDVTLTLADVLSTFEGSKVDFGDHLLFKATLASDPKLRCVFSNDADFYSFSGEIYLLTTNRRVIAKAASESKLLKA